MDDFDDRRCISSFAFVLLLTLFQTPSGASTDNLVLDAIKSGEATQLEELIKQGLDPKAALDNGNPPLYLAVTSEAPEMVKVLVDYGADVDAIDSKDDRMISLLHLAAARGNLPIAEILLDGGANIDPFNKKGQTPLVTAVLVDELPIVEYLADRGAALYIEPSIGESPLAAALRHPENTQLADFLEGIGARIDVAEFAKSTCDDCHSSVALGVTSYSQGSNLAGQHPDYLVKQMEDYRSGKLSSNWMTGPSNSLTDAVIRSLAVHYANAPPIGHVPHEDEVIFEQGKLLYESRSSGSDAISCADCHGKGGQGANGELKPRLAGLNPQFVSKQLADYRAGARSNDIDGTMRETAKDLTDEQIEALSYYIRHMQ